MQKPTTTFWLQLEVTVLIITDLKIEFCNLWTNHSYERTQKQIPYKNVYMNSCAIWKQFSSESEHILYIRHVCPSLSPSSPSPGLKKFLLWWIMESLQSFNANIVIRNTQTHSSLVLVLDLACFGNILFEWQI